MRVKRTVTTLAAVTAIVAGTASAATPATPVPCPSASPESWSVDGGAYKATQAVVVRRGGWLTITNNDVMSHQLVKTSGPAVRIESLKTPMAGMGMRGTFRPSMMAHMGASVKVTFAHAGTYRFTTKAGEDYMPGMKTIGEDNVLRLTVTVS